MNTMDEFCVKCRRKMFVAKVSQEVLELTERGVPYKHMCGDVLECPECHCQVVTRFGEVTAQHDEDFADKTLGFRHRMLEVV